MLKAETIFHSEVNLNPGLIGQSAILKPTAKHTMYSIFKCGTNKDSYL